MDQTYMEENMQDNDMSMYPETGVGCGDQVLAMAYVPVQHLDTVYGTDEAFVRGTLYPELDKPFLRGGETA